MLLDEISVSESTKAASKRPCLLKKVSVFSVGVVSPWPVAMIGAAWGEKEKLHGRS